MQRILVVLNPVSGVHRSRKIMDSIVSEFKKHDIKPDIEETQHRNHAYDITIDASNGDFNKIIGIGGDGTINEIARGLADSDNLDCKIGVIPTGVGNFIAMNLGITKNYKQAVNIAINDNTREIDIFEARSEEIDKRSVLGCLGVGFDSIIVQDIDNFRQGRRLSKFSYCLHCTKHMFRKYEDEIKVTIDDKELEGSYFWIEAVNTREYGGGFVFSPEADCSDGLLDLVTFAKPVHKRKIKYAWGLATGRMLKNSWVQMHRCRKVKIESAIPLPVQIDGDLAGTTPIEIEYSGKKARFISKH